jgi:hypothetical protein
MKTEQIAFAASVIVVACVWIAFAEHPTARNLRTAVIDTLGLV